jgi:hypothetical protein
LCANQVSGKRPISHTVKLPWFKHLTVGLEDDSKIMAPSKLMPYLVHMSSALPIAVYFWGLAMNGESVVWGIDFFSAQKHTSTYGAPSDQWECFGVGYHSLIRSG